MKSELPSLVSIIYKYQTETKINDLLFYLITRARKEKLVISAKYRFLIIILKFFFHTAQDLRTTINF